MNRIAIIILAASSFVAALQSSKAEAQVSFSLVPVSADVKPEDNPVPDGWLIDGNEIFLDRGGRPVWLEIYISDWDPDEEAIKITAYQAVLDSSGYSSGTAGVLTPFILPCTSHADCQSMGAWSYCGVVNNQADVCQAGFVDRWDPHGIFTGIRTLGAVDQSTGLNFRWGFAVDPTGEQVSVGIGKCEGGGFILEGKICEPQNCTPNELCPQECPALFACIIPCDGICAVSHADRYAGTLVLWVPEDAEGTFTLNLKPQPDTALFDEIGGFMPIELSPAKITIPAAEGSCCYNLDSDYVGCIDGVTAYQCEQLGRKSEFTVGGSCTGNAITDCISCVNDIDCDDRDPCTEDSCGPDERCTFAPSPVVDPPIDCCNLETGFLPNGEICPHMMGIVPVSADAKPDDDPPEDAWRVEGSEIILERGGRPVWLEFRLGDWDPAEEGIEFVGWQARIDSTGYSNGVGGPLAPFLHSCAVAQDCNARLGDWSFCGHPWMVANICTPGFINRSNPEFSFYQHTNFIALVDLAGLSYRYAGVVGLGLPTIGIEKCLGGLHHGRVCDPDFGDAHECPAVPEKDIPQGTCVPNHDDRYIGTLVLDVPEDAKGTYSIGMYGGYATGYFIDDGAAAVPRALISALITIEEGACCYDLESATPGCVAGATRNECDAYPPPRAFTVDGNCSGPCPEMVFCCLPDGACQRLPDIECTAAGGTIVEECLGDPEGNGVDNACEPGRIPTTSAWGLLVTGLILAVLARLRFRWNGLI